MSPSSFSPKRILTILLLAGLFIWTKKDYLDHYFASGTVATEPFVFTEDDLLLKEMPEIPPFPHMKEFNEIEIPFEPLPEEQLQEHQLELERQKVEIEKIWKGFKFPLVD